MRQTTYLIVAPKPYTLCISNNSKRKKVKFQLNFIFSHALIRILELQSEATNTLEAINIPETINISETI